MIEPNKNLSNIDIYETALYPENWDMKLDANENYIGPSTKVFSAVKNLSFEEIAHYPYYGDLYEALSAFNKVSSDSIVITNGADEALSSTFNAFVSSEENVVTVSPSFSMPKIYAEIIGAQYIEVPYKSKWVYPFESVISAINDKTKAILITTPNNPTGDIVPLEQIIEILEKFPQKLVIIDETYTTYSGISNVCLTEKFDNALVIKSMSKDFGLAGLRLGYIVSNSENIKNIKKVLSPYNVNSVAVSAGIASLEDKSYSSHVKSEIADAKAYLMKEFKEMGFVPYDSFANFILVDFGDKTDLIYNKLKACGVSVKTFSSEELKTHLRITIPTKSASRRLINCIKSKITLVFDMDGVLVDVSDSYHEAIKFTYNYFTGKELADEMIREAKKQGGLNNDWDLTDYLIKQSSFKFPYENIVKVFQKQYWNDGDGSINNETLLVDLSMLDELSKKYNMAIFTGRPKDEALYTLDKFNIKHYFTKIVTMNDLPPERQKPHTTGLYMIKDSFITEQLIYFGDTVDDAKCAKDFGAYGVGVLPPSDKSEELRSALLKSGQQKVINGINELKDILENFEYEKESDYSKN